MKFKNYYVPQIKRSVSVGLLLFSLLISYKSVGHSFFHFSALCPALIHSVVMEMTDETVSCCSHNIYPLPLVTWATDPPSAQEALDNSTIKTTDHKGLFTVVSTLRIVGNVSNITYFCSFISADRTQVWMASRKNQGDYIM